MSDTVPFFGWVWVAGLAGAGCAAAPPGVGPAFEADPGQDSPFAYLLRRYDFDGDGRVTRDEYSREGGEFDRLDRDGDGAVTAADFAPAGGGEPTTEARILQRHLMAAFQDDDDPASLTLEELERSLAAADGDGDGLLSEGELRARVDAADLPPFMRTMDPWRFACAAADGDGDGRLSRHEALGFFRTLDTDGDGAWTRKPRTEEDEEPSGPAPGTPAPDFTLAPPGGGETVTLSSFAGRRPVALVFGSWT